jgi:hypothetical protein
LASAVLIWRAPLIAARRRATCASVAGALGSQGAGCALENPAWRMCWREASQRARRPLVRGIPDRRGRRSVSCGSCRARSRGVVPTCDRTLGPAGIQHPHTGRASHPIRRTDRRRWLTAIGARNQWQRGRCARAGIGPFTWTCAGRSRHAGLLVPGQPRTRRYHPHANP